mmetsp:Transcript_13548/g.20342  ORF Transcript_13548/g.20342 Transcript_13548/m.20342 type:complete len:144 (+) Transcript_13548:41-472(+)|eukprot:CAMPEP_0185024492 /NCGR_PEP_ID=MMETSP1103-20130426/7583_1 /TAXON_ID=36769 /ORGANISM="Paraphysomonas bandaiensis, Strain Caron Lab Isolate" /LENGTH=143 /DNA_ID=CAMNT_0027557475 /DNA_START=41 /DNA_END=472 /DNA_ORIENTATION=+
MSTPKTKKPRLSFGVSSAQKALQGIKSGNRLDDLKAARVLCSCVVDASSGSNQDDAYSCLKSLLNEGVSPNFTDDAILEMTGGSPLYLAVKLNVPKAVSILLSHGASLVSEYDGKTPIQLAFEQNIEECIAVINRHISHLESK